MEINSLGQVTKAEDKQHPPRPQPLTLASILKGWNKLDLFLLENKVWPLP